MWAPNLLTLWYDYIMNIKHCTKRLDELKAGDILDNTYVVVRVTPTSAYKGNLILKNIATGERRPAMKRSIFDYFTVTGEN